MSVAPVIWTLTDGKIGMRAQAEGLAQQLALIDNGSVYHGTVTSNRLGKCLPPAIAAWLGLYTITINNAPAPAIVIGCGSDAQAPLLALKKQYRAFVVCVQRPAANVNCYNTIVAPAHDYKKASPSNLKLILTLGAVGKINNAALTKNRPQARQRFKDYSSPYIGVLIGGDNRAYQLDEDLLIKQLNQIIELSNATLLITSSRRTPKETTQRLLQQFNNPHYVWDGTGTNPYHDILAAADGFCVTADSVNMISEASASGRAVYVLPLRAKAGAKAQRAAKKFAYFQQLLIERGNIRLYNDHWQFFYSMPLDETRHAAEQLWHRYQQTKKT